MSIIGILPASDTVETDGDLAPIHQRTPGEDGGHVPTGLAGYIYDGAAYCPECAHDVMIECADDGETYPLSRFPSDCHDDGGFGVGIVQAIDEWDYPGASCFVCHRRLDTHVLVYDDGGAHPEPVGEVHDPDGMGRTARAFLLQRDDDDVRVMLAEDFRPYGDAGDTTWIPADDWIDPE